MLKKIEETVIKIIYLVIIILVILQVLSRYFLKESFSYSEEIVRYLFVWGTFLSIGLAFREKMHIKLNLFSERIKFFRSGAYHFFYYLAGGSFFILLLVFSCKVAWLQYSTKQTIVTRIPTFFLGLSAVIGALLVLAVYLQEIIEYLNIKKKAGE